MGTTSSESVESDDALEKGGLRRWSTPGLRSGEFLGEAGSGRPTMGDQYTSPDVGLDNLNVAKETLWGRPPGRIRIALRLLGSCFDLCVLSDFILFLFINARTTRIHEI